MSKEQELQERNKNRYMINRFLTNMVKKGAIVEKDGKVQLTICRVQKKSTRDALVEMARLIADEMGVVI